MALYIGAAIAAAAVLCAANYIVYLSRRAANRRAIRTPERVTLLRWFADDDNWLAFDMAYDRCPYPNAGFLPNWLLPPGLYLRPEMFVFYWKLQGKEGFTTFSNIAYSSTYCPAMGRIVIPPMCDQFVYLIDPASGKEQKIRVKTKRRKGGYGGFITDNPSAMLLVGPMLHEPAKKPAHDCTYLDISTGKQETFDLPGQTFSVLRAAEGVYFAAVQNKVYRIQNNQAVCVRQLAHEVRVIAAWSADNVIIQYEENDLPRLAWADVVLRFTHPRLLIEKADDLLWVVDFDGERYVLKTFDVSGDRHEIAGLDRKPYEIGSWQNKGIWLDYPDGTVETFDRNGRAGTCKLGFGIGMRTVDVSELATIGR